MATMLAGRLHLGDRSLRMAEVPVPDPGHGQVRVRVAAAGVCLSDVHLVDGTLTPVFLDGDVVTLGHEVAGVVEALGPGVVTVAEGQRVLLQAGELDPRGTVLTRGVDYDGGWAEYVVARQDTVVPIPDDLPFEQACIVPDAVSTPWGAITVTAATRPGEAAGVWGVGGLGTHAVQLLRLIGAAPIVAVDPSPAARDRVTGFGADLALDPADPALAETVREITGGRGLDVALDFAGVPPVRDQAIRLLGARGRLVLVGLAGAPVTIPQDTWFTYMQQRVLGSYGAEPQQVEELVRLLTHGRLDLSRSITDVLPLADAPAAVARLEAKEGDPIRLVLRP